MWSVICLQVVISIVCIWLSGCVCGGWKGFRKKLNLCQRVSKNFFGCQSNPGIVLW